MIVAGTGQSEIIRRIQATKTFSHSRVHRTIGKLPGEPVTTIILGIAKVDLELVVVGSDEIDTASVSRRNEGPT